MGEPRGYVDLPKKSIGPKRSRDVGIEDLDGDLPAMLQVFCKIHCRGRAAAYLTI